MKGQPDLKHWKQDKEMFSRYAEFYKENNQILEDFKAIYRKLIQEHPELSAKQVACFYKAQQQRTGPVTIAYIFAREPSYKNISKTFRALPGKAHKDPDVNFRLSRIGDFPFCDYSPCKYDLESKHPDILDSKQLRAF